jgi:1-deoxy-D-xylulose-5-phosphate synthase
MQDNPAAGRTAGLDEAVSKGSRSPVTSSPVLERISSPADVRALPVAALASLAKEVRLDLIDSVSQTGGHFGAGLGVVELTVALHHVFETPRDKIIWDVSHQCYPHKILTGRRDALRKVRQAGGPSGFTCRAESEYDPFGAAHSSTAISAGLGFAAARDLKGEDFHVVAVVGDGALSGGMAFEALNNAGAQGRRLIVIINDNDMSIAPPSGALRTHLTALRSCMADKAARRAAIDSGELISFAGDATLFEGFGAHYAGPFDGHEIEEVVGALKLAAAAPDGPIVLHFVTEKGRGYAPAATAPDKGHAVGQFDPATGVQKKSSAKAPSSTNVFAQALIAEASADESIVAITAAMPSGTGLDKFAAAHPERCFDAGIAEQHAVTFAAGMACEGLKPFAGIYSTFLQRAFDQVVHDVAIQKLPVRFAIDRAGLVGADGVTHQGSYDITYLGCLPHFVLMAPADEAELVHMVATAVAIDDRPSALRYPRGNGVGVALPEAGIALDIGKGRVLREGSDAAILSYGTMLWSALAAADLLATRGISVTVADARFAKPIDDALVSDLVTNHEVLLTVEEGAIGGFAAQVVDSLQRQRLADHMSRLASIYLPDQFIHHDSQDGQAVTAGLDVQAIAAEVAARVAFDYRRDALLGRAAFTVAAQ